MKKLRSLSLYPHGSTVIAYKPARSDGHTPLITIKLPKPPATRRHLENGDHTASGYAQNDHRYWCKFDIIMLDEDGNATSESSTDKNLTPDNCAVLLICKSDLPYDE